MTVHASQEKILLLARAVFDSGNDRGTVCVANFVGNYADSKRPPLAQRARKKIGTIIQTARGGYNPLTSSRWNVLRRWGVIQDGRNCSGRKPNMSGNILESD